MRAIGLMSGTSLDGVDVALIETDGEAVEVKKGVANGEQVVAPDVYSQLLRSPDEGVAEFLDLAHVKPNTLGNTRMLKHL